MEVIDAEVLISLVEPKVVLWDKTLGKYRDRIATRRAWEDVCLALKPDFKSFGDIEKNLFGKEVIRRWTNLRDCFVKAKKDANTAGSQGKKRKKYVYTDQLHFLNKIYNDTVDSLESVEPDEEETKQEKPAAVYSKDSSLIQTKPSNHKQKNTKHKKPDDVELKLLQALQPKPTCNLLGAKNWTSLPSNSEIIDAVTVKQESDVTGKVTCAQCQDGENLMEFTRAHNCPLNIRIYPEEKVVVEKQYACRICPQLFNNLVARKEHMIVHTNEKPFSCALCDETFKHKCAIKQHVFHHIGEKPFTCKYCKRKFRLKSSLKDHIFIHTGETPFVCQHCGKSFRLKTSYRNHERVHTGKRPYPCPLCDLAYKGSTGLKRHMYIHSGERPFSCDHCSRGFIDKRCLKLHIMRKHIKKKKRKKMKQRRPFSKY